MRNLHQFFSLLLLAALLGCATPEQGAYRVIGSIVVTVDGTMNGWGDYVRAGLSTPDEEAQVKAAYERYQATMRLARVTIATANAQPDGSSKIDTALATIQASSGQLIAIIQQLLQPKGNTP